MQVRFFIPFFTLVITGCPWKNSSSPASSSCSFSDSKINPSIMNANCSSLSKADCCQIKDWWNNLVQLGNGGMMRADGHYYYSLYGAVGKLDNDGNDVVTREFKTYCLEAKWTGQDCKSKISTLFTQFSADQEAEKRALEIAEKKKQEEEIQKKAKEKEMGY